MRMYTYAFNGGRWSIKALIMELSRYGVTNDEVDKIVHLELNKAFIFDGMVIERVK